MHEMLLDHLRVGPVQSGLKIRVYDPLGRGLLLEIMVDQLRIILRSHTGEALPLRLRDAELIEGFLDILRHLIPVRRHLRLRLDIGHDILHIQSVDGGTPGRNALFIVDLQGAKTEVPHPRRILLLL